ncbi:uncharacterized protein METZ01_LOCUS154591 [marine metagenome]|jgi:hypothetical protein|uniref:Uncharacterized protein n=1 Tax=marine metagenome TaxID=408172 RepID=A0A382AL71_9ZZZZ
MEDLRRFDKKLTFDKPWKREGQNAESLYGA